MILLFLLEIPLQLLTFLVQWFPQIYELPMGLDTVLQQGMGYFFFLVSVFPPFGTLYTAFLIVMGFKIAIMILNSLPLIGKFLWRNR